MDETQIPDLEEENTISSEKDEETNKEMYNSEENKKKENNTEQTATSSDRNMLKHQFLSAKSNPKYLPSQHFPTS